MKLAHTFSASSGGVPRRAGARRRGQAGMTLIEVVIALGILGLSTVLVTQAMLMSNRQAATVRMMTIARATVQRNIDTALSISFKKAAAPEILQITAAGGVTYDEGTGSNLIPLASPDSAAAALVAGTLKRTVLAVANPDNAEVRRITFALSYTYRGRTYVSSMSTVRAADD